MDFTITFVKLFFWTVYLIAPLLFFLGLVIIVLGQIVCRVEKWEKFDGLYWSFITATTVGYGDIRPMKKASKTLSVLIALVGMMFTGIIIAITLNTAMVAFEKHVDERVIEKNERRIWLILYPKPQTLLVYMPRARKW
uniref:Ion transport K+ channel n=1 Tax=uncultured organism TaxID=155900 RepID=E3T301_9ZZZZ|nr:ion transport K+ channel [uncultured organism]